MRHSFVLSTLKKLLSLGHLSPSDSVLALCAAGPEQQVFSEAGLRVATISNLDDRLIRPDFPPYSWSLQDAQNLTFDDNSFDHVFVSDGLHHCSSPHRALLEMFRVARKMTIVFESRDSMLMRLGCRLGLSAEFEVEAVIGSGMDRGGVNNTEVPNYVYRWTEREFAKAIQCFHPYGPCRFQYFYGMNVPVARLGMYRSPIKKLVAQASVPVAKLIEWVVPSQGNSFAMVAHKPGPDELWPWLKRVNGRVSFNREYAEQFRANAKS
ncbi:MAG: methyltransferase domain-containing protein [Verrucomicrobiae bacterium]|nr:methyltransferase domain-containing protein [Verrucomicrobiae bacterium]